MPSSKTTILGVDFSGAKGDRNTWLAQGTAHQGSLTLEDCRPISRADLAALLEQTPLPAVAALDFPFSVPQSFAQFWAPTAEAMPDLWRIAARLDLPEFIDLRNRFVAQNGEPKRLADSYHPECYSCLHMVNPNMVPMTFRGMQLLDRLWQTSCSVPPLDAANRDGPVLLEAMPGAALRTFGLPFKGYKNGNNASNLRRVIWDQLAARSGVPIEGLEQFQALALNSHDCLDAIAAAVVAVLWLRDPSLFRCPPAPGEDNFDPVVLLEGWLYAPVFIQSPH